MTGKTYITSPAYGGCSLVAGPDPYETFYDGANIDNNAKDFTAVMVDRFTVDASTTVAIRCGNGFAETWRANNSVLCAIRVSG